MTLSTIGKWFFSAALGASALWATGVASAQVNAEQVLRIGQNVMSMNDYMLAISYFNQAIKAKPFLFEPYLMRAIAKVNLEDFKGAEEDCTLALERNRYYPEPYRLRGFCRLVQEKDSLAVADFDEGLRIDPKDKWMQYYRAIALTEGKQYERADSAFRKVLEANPKFDEAYSQKARMNYLRGDTVTALEDLDRSIELSKNIINNYLLRAQINSERANWAAVASDLDEAIRLEPNRADLYVNRATARYHDDNFFGTMEDLTRALELDPDNRGALYNRALLRTQVRELAGAAEDFTAVLKADPENFHALYNRALIYMDMRRYRDAIADFTAISKHYPKFYPLYYGIAQAREALGEHDAAIRTALYAEDMVRKYVANPRRNPLDRPTIDDTKINSEGMNRREDESEIDVMERYNQLVAVSATEDVALTYDDKIKGKVQDRNMNVEREPMFSLSVFDTRTSLRPMTNYFREVEDINNARLLSHRLFVSNTLGEKSDQAGIDRLFSLYDEYNSSIYTGRQRPVDYFGRGVIRSQLKNYREAIADFDKAIELNGRFTAAYLARSYAEYADGQTRAAASDLDRALELNPRLIFAWFNKGNLYFDLKDYQSAMESYGRAIEINPDFGEAYYNRGLAYLASGEKEKAFDDLSRAGELGVLPSYRLLKNLQ